MSPHAMLALGVVLVLVVLAVAAVDVALERLRARFASRLTARGRLRRFEIDDWRRARGKTRVIPITATRHRPAYRPGPHLERM